MPTAYVGSKKVKMPYPKKGKVKGAGMSYAGGPKSMKKKYKSRKTPKRVGKRRSSYS